MFIFVIKGDFALPFIARTRRVAEAGFRSYKIRPLYYTLRYFLHRVTIIPTAYLIQDRVTLLTELLFQFQVYHICGKVNVLRSERCVTGWLDRAPVLRNWRSHAPHAHALSRARIPSSPSMGSGS